MKIKVDFHIHSRNSYDSLNSIEKIIQYAKRKNLNLIGITDHNFLSYFPENENVKFIFGEEIKTKDGEVIGYFLKEKIKKGMTIMDTIKAIKDQDGIVCIPHPLDRLRRSAIGYENLMRIMDYVDIIEVFNARTTFIDDNLNALKIAKEYKKGMSAGSDAHIPFEIGSCSFEMNDFKTKDELLISLKNVKINMGLSPFVVHLPSTFAKYYNRIIKIFQKI